MKINIQNIPCVFLLSIVISVLFFIDFITNGSLTPYFGIVPRNPDYLLGIVLSPFAHGSFNHLINNLVSFLILGIFLNLSFSNKNLYLILLSITIISGSLTWLFAGNGIHIGASGVIFGMWSLLITLAIKRRKMLDIIVGLMIVVLFGASFIFGIIPKENISFEGHIFGLIAGFLTSLFIISIGKDNEIKNTN